MQHLNESAVHGVILVAGMVVIVSGADGASWDVLVKVAATVGVFWASHVFAGLVAHLGDEHAGDPSGGVRLFSAARSSLAHAWGMLAAALVPVSVLMLGATGVITDEQAIWGSLWVASRCSPCSATWRSRRGCGRPGSASRVPPSPRPWGCC